jgi:hypothetical protein
MFPPGIGPCAVGELKVHMRVSTTVSGGCSTAIVALANALTVGRLLDGDSRACERIDR